MPSPKKPLPKLAKLPKLSRTHAPADLSTIEWQRELRRQFGREQSFGLENTGGAPFFSEFLVSNPQSKSRYRVAIRGLRPGDNFCACPDYATNELGTCKHIEFVLDSAKIGYFNNDGNIEVQPGLFKVWVGGSSEGGLEGNFTLSSGATVKQNSKDDGANTGYVGGVIK